MPYIPSMEEAEGGLAILVAAGGVLANPDDLEEVDG